MSSKPRMKLSIHEPHRQYMRPNEKSRATSAALSIFKKLRRACGALELEAETELDLPDRTVDVGVQTATICKQEVLIEVE